MTIVKRLTQPPWRTLFACLLVLAIGLVGYQLWTPGKCITDGRHDLKHNGIWLQHGWLGDDGWFKKYQKNPQAFRNSNAILQLRQQLLAHHITDLYPHVAPCLPTGEIAPVDPQQTKNFLTIMDEFRVMPWIGGVLDVQVFPASPKWRTQFITSIHSLLTVYPQFAGIHLNIEPLPTGNGAYLKLLQELSAHLPPEKLLSIAAYPPPTLYQRSADVHWQASYYRQIAQYSDQLVVMMYDTSLRYQKLYQQLMASWTQEVLRWSGETDVLLGLPTYDDEGVGYHHPHVENLRNGLAGIHAGLARFPEIPKNYQGISLYSEWEMDQQEWKYVTTHFLQN